MALNPALAKLLSRVYKRQRDPRRAARVYREYDLGRGYSAYHRRCREGCSASDRAAPEGDLKRRGFQYLSVLSAADAQALLARLQAEHEVSLLKKDTRHLEGFHVTDPDFIERTLRAVLTRAVDRELVGFFDAEYLVHWITFSLTPQAPEQASVSFRWHCDRGPRAHLKLIVYLNPTTEHGGNTEFIDLADTARVAARGYLFGWTQTRTGDVGELARLAGCEIGTHAREMAAGEGVVFQPANVLHRGLSPRLGPRYVMTLCLLPSPVPWHQALARGALSDLSRDPKWHRHASELLSVLT